MTRSEELTRRAQQVMPAGVNSSNRVMPWPLAVVGAAGAHFTDADGREYLDYHAAFGPLVLGHNHPAVNAAVQQALTRVDLIGAGVTDLEVDLAEKLCAHIPVADQVLLTNSGSEATYIALRLARAVTGRRRVVKFQGGYHGWHDAIALNVLSAPDKVGRPDPLSRGSLDEVLDLTTVLPFNDSEALRETFARTGDEIAAVIVEVIPHNIGCVLPRPEFLDTARALTRETGALLIFDEVVTGFRHALGGYQSLCGVTPDLATFAKAMANGFPIAALAGRSEFMAEFGPGRGVFYAGTYNGHPVGVAAALATIAALEDGTVHQHSAALASHAADGLQKIADGLGIELTVARFGSVFVPYFLSGPIESYTDLLRSDNARDVWFRRQMCEEGIFMVPTALKRNHVSAAHTARDIDRTLDTAQRVLARMPASVPG